MIISPKKRGNTRLKIKPPQQSREDENESLPRADTCFFHLELPNYANESILERNIRIAINFCGSLDGDVELNIDNDPNHAGGRREA